MQRIQLIGNLTRDCIVNQVNGRSVINFSVAINQSYKDRNGVVVNKASFYDCAYWTDKTGIAQYLTKGTMCLVEGEPEAKMFTTRDGKTAANISVRVGFVKLLGSPNKDNQRQQPQDQSTKDLHESIGDHKSDFTEPLDDLPF